MGSQRTPRHSRTTADAAAERGWVPMPRSGKAYGMRQGDGNALTVLRTVTYVLVCLTCLVLLAAAAWTALTLRDLQGALSGLRMP